MRPLLAALAAVVLVAAGCGGEDDATRSEVTASPSVAEPTANSEPQATPTNGIETGSDSDERPDADTDNPDTNNPDTNNVEELFPDVLAAEATQAGDGTWNFNATVSSPYDSPERYADAWRILGPDGTQYGIRVLVHDHASEQPFTRSVGGIEIPDDVTTVTIEGRDQVSGWGGETVDVELLR